MTLEHYLPNILILLTAAVVMATLMRRILGSPVLGFLLAGLIIGPSALGFIKEIDEVKAIAEYGVIFLLFTIGLELSWERLVSLRLYVFGLGALQVLVSSLVIGGIAFFGFHLDLDTSILIGAGLSLSSTAVVVQVLAERGELAARYGRISFSILLFQDLAVVLLLVLVNLLARENAEFTTSLILTTVGISLIKGIGVIVAIMLLGRVLVRPIYRIVATTKNSELFVGMTLLMVLLTSYATEFAGLSMELGAFLAGLLIAETEYRHQVEADIQPFRGLFLGLFFMSIGMGINLDLLFDKFLLVSGLVLALILGKAIILTFLCKVYNLWWATSLRIGLLLSAGGEFLFILLTPATASDLIPPHITQILFLVVAISMAFTPLLSFLGKYASRYFDPPHARLTPASTKDETGDLKSHVVIVGFGRIGQIVAKLLGDQLVPYVAIDMNMTRVSEGRKQGLPVFFGDARRADIFHAIGTERAKTVVLTIDQQASVSRIVLNLKRNFPDLPIFVRAHDVDHAQKLEKAGATVIVPETLEPSLQLASAILLLSGIPEDQVSKSVETVRHTLWARKDLDELQQTLRDSLAETLEQK